VFRNKGFHRLVFRSLIYYWRTNLPIVAGVAVAVAVLSGALLVGESVRASLRQLLFEQIGAIGFVVTSDHFFTEDLAEAIGTQNGHCPIIFLKGTVIHEQTGIRAHDVNIYGVDERFWKFHGLNGLSFSGNRIAFAGEALARRLNAHPDSGLLLRVETQQSVPREWLYGRRDTVGRTIRLNCGRILSQDELGAFSLRPSQGEVLSIFVPLARLQKDLDQPSRINTILLSDHGPGFEIPSIQQSLKSKCTLKDLALRLRDLPSGKGFSLESDRILLDDSTARAANEVALQLGLKTSGIYTYLANSIRANHQEIPYSTITATELGAGALETITPRNSLSEPAKHNAKADPIWLTDWACQNLKIAPGASVEVDYYLWQEKGTLTTQTARFQLAGVVSTSGDVNAALVPNIPGISDTPSISSWDPPFPLNLSRIRKEDEDYWEHFHATPKAFISLANGQTLWKSRFGKLTSIRLLPPIGTDVAQMKEVYSRELLKKLNMDSSGITVQAIRNQGLMAAQGSTDFGEYFVYFSSFLIAAAILLAGMFFKLMIEQRTKEIGILQASGFSSAKLRRLFLAEGLILSLAGSFFGLLGAIGYGWMMMLGLRTWWADSVGTQQLSFHISVAALAWGICIGVACSLAILLWALRSLRGTSSRQMLTGVLDSMDLRIHRKRMLQFVSWLAFLVTALLICLSFWGIISQLAGFFLAGFFLLVAILCLTGLYLNRAQPMPVNNHGWRAVARLGLRNAVHRPGRSLLCAGMIASATFIIVSIEAFRQDTQSISLEKTSGTGGYSYIAQTDLPIIQDLNDASGREAIGISEADAPLFPANAFISFRERPGDDVSCLNLYAPQQPKILGAPADFISSGRFGFQDSLAINPEQKLNPWLLLESQPGEVTVPAISDANTIQYILHRSLGSELIISDGDGNPIRLRLVAALQNSIFQGELLISEVNFRRIFPKEEGYRFFLIDAQASKAAALIPLLKEQLSDWGFRAEFSRDRLAAYHRVENTYLSTFQFLGALGLILGTLGMAAVLLRNVLERRHEFALLRAVGFRQSTLSAIVFVENLVLISWGLLSGVLCAFLAILPALMARGAALPLATTGFVMMAVGAAGITASFLAVIAAFRSPLIPALNSE
jgi:putative ABC transport system permease protein